jgi:ribose transport system permease protein
MPAGRKPPGWLAPMTVPEFARPMREAITRLRYRYWPDHWLGEILSKRWTETAIPVFVLLIVGFWLSQSIHNFL